MLAHTFKFPSLKKKSRGVNIKLPAYCQRKFDGIRCLAYIKDGRLILISRKGKQFKFLDHIRKDCTK